MNNQIRANVQSDSENEVPLTHNSPDMSVGERQNGNYDSCEHFNIWIEKSVAEYLYKLGEDDLSKGITRVVRSHRGGAGE